MRALHITLVALPLLALGCRTDPNQVLLEQESRMLEDKVYHLQACLDDCHAAREATTRENEALKKELAEGGRGSGYDSSGPALAPPSDGGPSRRSRRGESPKLEAPTIELPEPSDTPPAEKLPSPEESALTSGQLTQLVINERLTVGMDRDGQNGDDGVLVVVEPRDAQGRLIKAPGAVSLVVMDPSLEGGSSRLARWDFAAGDAANHFQNEAQVSGLRFELPWPGQSPQHRNLRLFVRCTTADGRKINAEAPIEVRSPSDPPRWSAAESAKRPSSRRPPSRPKSSRSTAVSASESPAAPDDAEAARYEPARQASRPDRPAWKPYR